MICMATGRISLGYPGYISHAIWSMVMAMIAMVLIQLEFNPAFMSAPVKLIGLFVTYMIPVRGHSQEMTGLPDMRVVVRDKFSVIAQ